MSFRNAAQDAYPFPFPTVVQRIGSGSGYVYGTPRAQVRDATSMSTPSSHVR